jgi:NADPH-dependent 7-cyano-7-deazaguanine reductase QueF-like protein
MRTILVLLLALPGCAINHIEPEQESSSFKYYLKLSDERMAELNERARKLEADINQAIEENIKMQIETEEYKTLLRLDGIEIIEEEDGFVG